MAVFELTNVLENLSQLDILLFKTTQQALEHDIHAFVSVFDHQTDASTTELPPISPDDLASAFIQLNSCQTHLEVAKKQDGCDLSNELNDMKQTVCQVQDVLTIQERRESKALSPLETQRREFMDQLQQRRKQEEQDLQRQYDKLEEHYAKKTRDSIYQNLVGTNAWLNGQ